MTTATTKIITKGLLGKASNGMITAFFSLWFVDISIKRAGRAGIAGGTVYEPPRRYENDDEDSNVYNVIIKLKIKSHAITRTYQVSNHRVSRVVKLINIMNATKRSISIVVGQVQQQAKRLAMAVKSVINRDSDK